MSAPERALHWLLAALAVAVWLLPWLLLGRREAWDHWSYFLISLPLMTAFAGYAGYRAKSRSWRWPVTLIVAQFVTAIILGGFGNLFPLGIVVFVVLALPMVVAAWVGAWLGRRKDEPAT